MTPKPHEPFEAKAVPLSDEEKKAKAFRDTVMHLIQSNVLNVYSASGDIMRHVYGPNGIIAGFLSLDLDPTDKANYDTLRIGKSRFKPADIERMHQRLCEQRPDITFKAFELPKDTIRHLNNHQRANYKRYRDRQVRTGGEQPEFKFS